MTGNLTRACVCERQVLVGDHLSNTERPRKLAEYVYRLALRFLVQGSRILVQILQI